MGVEWMRTEKPAARISCGMAWQKPLACAQHRE
jgi:hypothetical protein